MRENPKLATGKRSYTMEQIIAQELLEVLAENIQLMFQKYASPTSNIENTQRPEFENDFMCMISLANQQFQGQMVVGFQNDTVNDMLEEVMQLASNETEASQLLRASLGELLNTVAGAYAQQTPLLDAYDSLDLSTPSVYTKEDVPFFCKSDGFCGSLSYPNGEKINCYISISPYISVEKSDGDEFDISSFLEGDDLDDLLNGL